MTIEIVSVTDVQQRLARGKTYVGIVDARPRDEFERGHLPGAVCLEWEQWCGAPPRGAAPVLSEPGYWGTLAALAPAQYAQRLSRQGVSSDHPIVVYADGERSKGREGRIAWMLLYLGAQHVALLDGGWTAWREQGGSVEMGVGWPAPHGHFTVSMQPRRRWTQERLAQAYRDGCLPTLVDTRTPAEYAGDCYDYLPRKGRLPGALLFPFRDLFTDRHHYAGRETYQALLPSGLRRTSGDADGGEPHRSTDAAGLESQRMGGDARHEPQRTSDDGSGREPDESVVAYCEVGVRASLMALLHEAHTGQVVGVFDGSLIEWALHAELPVHGPPAP